MTLRDRLQLLTVELESERAALVVYAGAKMRAHDWHAVQDAGSDIRELDAQLSLIADLGAEHFTHEQFPTP